MSARRRNTAPTRTKTVVGMIVFLVCLLIGTWAVTGSWRDAQDLTWVRCEVIGAESQQGGRHASVPWYVRIDTQDCGIIAYRVGTNRDNVEGLAATFEPGPYEFKFGRVSQRAAAGDSLLDNAADAKDMRKVPSRDGTKG